MQTLSSRPPSGVRRITIAALIDRELSTGRHRSSLAGFCDYHGVTLVHAAAVLEGLAEDSRLLVALADTLGVSTESLRELKRTLRA